MTAAEKGAARASEAPGPVQRLRFGILCNGLLFPAWQAAVIRNLLVSGAAEPVLLIIEARPEQGRARTRRTLFHRLFQRYWAKRRLAALRSVSLSAELGDLPMIVSRAALQSPDQETMLSPEAATELRGHRLDFVLQCTASLPPREIVNATRLGVWSYHATSEDAHGALTAFWVYRNALSILPRVLFRRMPRETSILYSGAFRAGASWAGSLDAALLGSADWCTRVCRQLLIEPHEGGCTAPLHEAALQARLPNNGDVLSFLLRRSVMVLRALLRRCFFLEYWNVGLIDASIDSVISKGRADSVRWLGPKRPLHYLADPFALPEMPGWILCEEYSHRTGLGWISALPLSDRGSAPRRLAPFDRGTHRSYPFLFTADGAIYCVPESAAERRVELYRAVNFPDRWQRVSTLVEEFPALDTSVFLHEDRWWLFCTSADEGGEHKLHAWHAAALAGPWQPHRLNPLKCDVSSSRPAGRPFMAGGSLYRPAQDCSRTYGGAIILNKITRLTPTAFAEEPAGRIEPAAASGYGDGLHTVCPFGSATIIDGKRFVFDLRTPFLGVMRAIERFRPKSDASGTLSVPSGSYQK